MVDRDDAIRLGMKTSAITLGRWDVAAIMFFYAAYLGLWWYVLQPFVQSAVWFVAVAVAAAQALWHWTLIRG